ncbi:hypothetical protein V6N11_031380 [Hibiscus sabdariffa]|uniref:Nucleic acid binding NABP domain-containing protein n=1 Tax=Hibiscus sabdariffa TaxID=183260 RepID=A0ABR2SXH0_9ROSI
MHERNGEDTNVLVTDSAETIQEQLETCSIEATESDGFGEQQQQSVTSSIESKVFNKLSVITDVDLDDFDYSTSGLLEVSQNEGCAILNRGLLDPSSIQGIQLDSLMVMRGMSFAGANVVTGEWVSNYNPCRFSVPSFDPGGSNTTISSSHDVIHTGSNVRNLHSYIMLELAESIAKLSRLSLSRTRNIDTNAYMRSQIQADLYNQLDFPFNIPNGLYQSVQQQLINQFNAGSSTCMLVENHEDTLQGKVWAPTHSISTISYDMCEEPCYDGVPLSSNIEQRYGVGDIISFLWFKCRLPMCYIHFIKIYIMLYYDQDTCISTAYNIMVTTSAEKDLGVVTTITLDFFLWFSVLEFFVYVIGGSFPLSWTGFST